VSRAVVGALFLALACARGDLESTEPEERLLAVRRAASGQGERDLAVLLVAQRDPSSLVRRATAEAFEGQKGPRAADALGALLRDPDPEVAAVAARGLGALPDEPRAREHLVAAYAHASPVARAAIADALDRIGTSLSEAVEREARTLWERNVAMLAPGGGPGRAGAAEELGASARADAVARLLPLVDPNRNADPVLVAAASRGLAAAGDWSARPHLEALLAEPQAEVAESAAAALGALGDPGAADALASAATNGPARLARVAVDALAALPAATEVGLALCELAARSPEPAVAATAARHARARDAECPERAVVARLARGEEAAGLAALAELGLEGDSAQAASDRVAALLDGRGLVPALRPAAARTLGRLGTPKAGPAAIARATAVRARLDAARAAGRGDDAAARAEAAELGALLAAAGMLRSPGADALLPALVGDPSSLVRAGAIEGLGWLASGAGLEPVVAALGDADPGVRTAAIAAAPRFGARAVPALSGAVRQGAGDPETLSALARALGDTGAAEAVPALAALLSGPAARDAAAALGRIAHPSGAPALVEALRRPDAPPEAIEALSLLAVPDAGPAIAALLTSDRAELRVGAARALGKLRHEPASARLEALRSDYDGRVRRAAIEAIAKLPAGGPKPRR
jgi:HEAT repeat protein